MTLDFSHITDIVIPEGNVTKIESGSTILWQKIRGYIKEWFGYPIQTAYSLAGNLLNYKLYGNTKQQLLPDGYTQLAYIESTGTQYIDTGVTLDNNSGIDINYEVMSYDTSGGAKVFGYTSDNNFTRNSFAIANKWAGRLNLTFGYGAQKFQSTASTYTNIGKHHVVFNNKTLYFDNEQVTTFNDETFSTGNIAIGNINTSTGVEQTLLQ